MKRILLACMATGMALSTLAQDTTATEKADTIKVGGMIIIKKSGEHSGDKDTRVVVRNRTHNRNANIVTNWLIVDLGCASFTDNTNYTTAQSSGFVDAGINEESMKLRNGKSVNVNIWMFMQKMNVISHVVNLKYGLGVELNNYRFANKNLTIETNPTRITLPGNTAKSIQKNKLAADYLTVPLMLNFDFTPGRKNGFGFSAGVSGGYLYSARQKFKYDDNKKEKVHDDFNLNKWKLSYVGELSLGPVRLYGSIANKSMWEKGLDQTPYNVGIRFSHM